MADNDPDDNKPSTVIGKISGLVGLYAVFVFLSGWTYLDYYYRSFGVATRWLDLSVPEILTKGFVILFDGGEWLWLIYIFILVVPLCFEVFPRFRAHTVTQLVVAIVMLSCLPLTYYIARNAGTAAAKVSQGRSSTLPDVRFTTKCGVHVAKLLFLRENSYYLHDVQYFNKRNPVPNDCLEPSDPQKAHELTILRSEEVTDIKIGEYK
jgi:hypothetical protein